MYRYIPCSPNCSTAMLLEDTPTMHHGTAAWMRTVLKTNSNHKNIFANWGSASCDLKAGIHHRL